MQPGRPRGVFQGASGAGEAAIVLARNGAVQSVTWGGKRYVPRTEIYVVSEFLARIRLIPGRKQPYTLSLQKCRSMGQSNVPAGPRSTVAPQTRQSSR